MTETVDFSGVSILQHFVEGDITPFQAMLDSLDAPPVFTDTYYLCRSVTKKSYELWLCRDHFENGQFRKQECLSAVAIGESIASRLLGDICEADKETLRKFDTEKELSRLIARIREEDRSEAYVVDLENDLNEVLCCMGSGAYRAALALCGRLLELSLKTMLMREGVPLERDWMVGKLLSVAEQHDVYLDPSLKNIWNIVNQQRIVGVHAKERVPIPSKNQAMMVTYAVLDVLERCVLDA